MEADDAGTHSDPDACEAAAVAAQWLSRQDRGLSASEARDLERWLAVPGHAAEFRQIERAWSSLDRLKDDPKLALMASRLEKETRPVPSRRFNPYWTGVLASAAVLAVILWTYSTHVGAPIFPTPTLSMSYRVVPSAARLLTLPDGSLVNLRGDSEVSTDFTPGTRSLRLVRGEAHFKVTKNAARPFIVSVGSLAVRAVGTAFDIQSGDGRVEVVVTEGKVTVENVTGTEAPPAVPLLVAGQRAVISTDDEHGAEPRVVVESISPADVEQYLAWQRTWLEFDRTPLDEAVKAFNDRSSTKIILGDAALANRRLGGTFRADNVEGFVRLLEQSVDVRSERSGENEIVLLPAHQ
ncbi:MAG TPA: FecR domain-containing protein [Opitutaceae bacterium]